MSVLKHISFEQLLERYRLGGHSEGPAHGLSDEGACLLFRYGAGAVLNHRGYRRLE